MIFIALTTPEWIFPIYASLCGQFKITLTFDLSAEAVAAREVELYHLTPASAQTKSVRITTHQEQFTYLPIKGRWKVGEGVTWEKRREITRAGMMMKIMIPFRVSKIATAESVPFAVISTRRWSPRINSGFGVGWAPSGTEIVEQYEFSLPIA